MSQIEGLKLRDWLDHVWIDSERFGHSLIGDSTGGNGNKIEEVKLGSWLEWLSTLGP